MLDSILESARYQKRSLFLKDFNAWSLKGPDSLGYLQAQVTTDVQSLEKNQGQLSCRLNRTGQLVGWFFVLKNDEEQFYLVIHKNDEDSLIEDLEKYIIMEDVEISMSSYKCCWLTNHEEDNFEQTYQGFFFGEESFLFLTQKNDCETDKSQKTMTKAEFDEIYLRAGYPPRTDKKVSITSTFFTEIGLNLNKGCFLGQEAVSKIMNNRGAPYYPVVLTLEGFEGQKLNNDLLVSEAQQGTEFMVDGHTRKAGDLYGAFYWDTRLYLCANLYREYRVVGRKLHIKVKDGEVTLKVEVSYFPFFKDSSTKARANELYEKGVEFFQAENEELAIQYLEKAISIEPSFADAYESLGVIYGRHEKYTKALSLMDNLLEVDPNSVMAHTNKSLYFMKIGEIEKAEEEKSLATVASFKSFGKQAQEKKAEEEKKKQEILERESMFRQVLEIDSDDLIANYGLADIHFLREEFDHSIDYLLKVLKNDPKYSTAYLLLGKCYQALEKTEKARETFTMGIDVATKKGDLMPANEMQSLLREL